MDPNILLQRLSTAEITPAEETELIQELSAAYHMDEAAASSREVQRIAEKVQARLNALEAESGKQV